MTDEELKKEIDVIRSLLNANEALANLMVTVLVAKLMHEQTKVGERIVEKLDALAERIDKSFR